MKFSHLIFMVIILNIVLCCKPEKGDGLIYIDRIRPTHEPRVFAKGFISKDSVAEFGSVFNEKGTEFFYAVDSAGTAFIKYTTIRQEEWLKPINVISDSEYSFNDPFLSPDESKLYYISNLPLNSKDTIEDYDIWYSERQEEEWSEPINAGKRINSIANEYYISFTDNGSMYFASNIENHDSRNHDFDIFKSENNHGEFRAPVKLSDSINSGRYEADVFISPDESYVIFCSARRSGLGRGDLYISFKSVEDTWTKSINMGARINSAGHELCPFVTRDGKYFFYTSNQDIYWVSTTIIDSLKNTVNLDN